MGTHIQFDPDVETREQYKARCISERNPDAMTAATQFLRDQYRIKQNVDYSFICEDVGIHLLVRPLYKNTVVRTFESHGINISKIYEIL